MKIAFFDAKSYDIEAFEKYTAPNFSIKFFETKLTEDTCELARGRNCVCVFVNDTINTISTSRQFTGVLGKLCFKKFD